jgi:hypothetical protein
MDDEITGPGQRFVPSGRARRPGRRSLVWLALVALTLGLALALWLHRGAGDDARRLLAAGDRVAAGGRAELHGRPLTARAAYLLAFHAAQDRQDVAGMRRAADRLAVLGEAGLALSLRLAAEAVAAELTGWPPAPDADLASLSAPGRTSGGSGSPGAGSRGAPSR